MKNIFVSTKRRDVAVAIKESLSTGDQLTIVSGADDGFERLQGQFCDILFFDMEGMVGHTARKEVINATRGLLDSFNEVQPGMEVVVIAPAEHVREAVMAVKAGASNYLTHPVDPEEVRLIISEISEEAIIQSELKHLRDESWATVGDDSAGTRCDNMKRGKFEVARGGTLFLDEIGTITATAQIKLLTVIQESEFSRVGGELLLRTDVRLVAATNMDLKALVDEGTFRKDLYYRLNVFPILVPPLRERKADIPLLVDAFINRFNRLNTKRIRGVHPTVMAALQHYDWPGNIRELQNIIERAHILETGDTLTPESFPQEIVQSGHTAAAPLDMSKTLADVRRQAVEDTERQYLRELVARNSGRINVSAAEAGISTRQLNKLLNRYGIHKEAFKPGHTDGRTNSAG